MLGTGHDHPARPRPRVTDCARVAVASPGAAAPTWFFGSVGEGPGRRRVILRGEIGVVAADRLQVHLAEICATTVRHIIVDATEARRCDPLVLELLDQTQHRLAARRGLLTVIGLPSTPARAR